MNALPSGRIARRRRLVALLPIVLALPVAVAAQQTVGRIEGRVIDAASGQGLTSVGVQVVGTTLGTMTRLDGRYTIPDVPAGTVTLQVRRLGFTPKTVTGLQLAAGTTLEQDVTMEAATITLSAQVVTASAERGSVNEALDAQRTATGIVNSVTAEQIRKSPDSDAAQAISRVSGVTVQGGRYVFVRGLGERYTTTQLNGTRVPSPEPERRVVPLDMFPSSLLEAITTSKTYTPDQQGDFSGGVVEIKTREFPVRTQFSYQLTMGMNSGATGRSVLRPRDVGGERFALSGSERKLPYVFGVVKNFQGLTLNQGDKNYLLSQLRNAWTPAERSGDPNTSTALSVGGNQPVFGTRVGYVLSGTYAYTQELRDNQVRALADRGSRAGETTEIDRFEGTTGSQGVLWGGLANFSTLVGGNTRLMFNNTYNRTADNDARRERGNFENEGLAAQVDRMQYVERSLRSNQVAAEHQFGEIGRLDWAVTSSGVTRDEPDRSEFVYVVERDSPDGPEKLRWLNTGNGGAVRTFSALHERSTEGRANYQLAFSLFGRQHSVKIGALHRATDRDADTKAYAISAPLAGNTIRELAPERLFAGPFTGEMSSTFDIFPLAQGGSYGARDRLTAGYLMTELALGERFRLITGARYERDALDVDAQSTLGTPVATSKRWNDILLSAALNVRLGEYQNLRLSVSRTLARPEYRELAPIKSRDVLNGDDLEGNADLRRTRIHNADLRWELYPGNGEVLSAGIFAKRFDDPIERVYRAAGASSRFIGYVNADRATNYGVELEARKNLGFLGALVEPLSVFANVTLMQSAIDLGAAQSAATNRKRRMVGQAPSVVNAGLTYAAPDGQASATILFNRTGDRIDAAGDLPLPDVVQVARSVMDLSLRFPVLGPLHGRLDARNLLDEPFRTVQGTVTRESWTTGRTFQLGFIYRP